MLCDMYRYWLLWQCPHHPQTGHTVTYCDRSHSIHKHDRDRVSTTSTNTCTHTYNLRGESSKFRCVPRFYVFNEPTIGLSRVTFYMHACNKHHHLLLVEEMWKWTHLSLYCVVWTTVRLCARSWLSINSANMQITWSSGGSSHHNKRGFFIYLLFFWRKIMRPHGDPYWIQMLEESQVVPLLEILVWILVCILAGLVTWTLLNVLHSNCHSLNVSFVVWSLGEWRWIKSIDKR